MLQNRAQSTMTAKDLLVIAGIVVIVLGVLWVLVAAIMTAIRSFSHGTRTLLSTSTGWPDVALEFLKWMERSVPRQYGGGFGLIMLGGVLEYFATKL